MTSFLGLGKKKLTRVAIIDEATQFIEFEATISASHQGSATITKHPVEAGSNVTDHIRTEPDTLNLDVVVSDTPLIILASLRAEPSVPGGNPRTRSVDAYEFIKGIKDKGKTVSISTKLRDYDSMAISSIGITQDAVTGNIARMSIDFEEIKIATTQTVDVPEPVNPSRKPKESIGKTSKAPATPKVTENVSVLRGLFGG